MSKALEQALNYLVTKVDQFEEKYFAAKKDDERAFVLESINFYRYESAALRAQLFATDDDAVSVSSGDQAIKEANEEMLPEEMRGHIESDAVNP